MKILFYENDRKNLRIFLNQEGNYDNYTLEIGSVSNPNPFYLAGEFVNNVPDLEEKICFFKDEIKRFNPLILKNLDKINIKESDLIKALRETKKCAKEEQEFERNHPNICYQ